MKKFLDKQFGLEFVDRGDGHILIQLLSEDDEIWHKHGETFSTYWLPELIRVLQHAQNTLDKDAFKTDWGYEFNV